MVRKRNEWPEVDEYVIATVTKVTPHSAYVELDEYNYKEGMIHISEIGNTWVRNIKNYLQESQKVVVKVLSVNPVKGHIDLSLRRVTTDAKRNKLQEWKRAQKAEKFLELLAEEVGGNLDEAYELIGWPLEDKFGEIYAGLEAIATDEEKAIEDLDIPEKWKTKLIEMAVERIEIPKVELKWIVKIQVFEPDGIKTIKEALIKGQKAGQNNEGIELKIYLEGSPRYRIEIVAQDYQQAEMLFEKIKRAIENTIKGHHAIIQFNKI